MSHPLDELLDQVRLLWHVTVLAGERLHEGEAVTLGMRAVLEFLEANGPRSVPEIARMKKRERHFLDGLELSAKPDELKRAAAVLKAVRKALGGRP